MPTPPRVVVAGGGIGGLALAIGLTARGVPVEVHEQARRFATVGDAINLTPNAVRALDHLGVGPQLRPLGYHPDLRINRQWDTGEATSVIPLGDDLQRTYGTPLMMLRRSDLVEALVAALPAGVVHLGRRVVDVTQDSDGATLVFDDGTTATGDLVVGADGIHSVVRDRVLGARPPAYTGIVAYRTLVPTARVQGRVDDRDLASFVKWWGPDRTSQIVTYPTGRGDEFFVFATHADPDWRQESWSAAGDPDEMRAAFRDYHPAALELLAPVDDVLKTALHDREPLDAWTTGRVTLLGDACHPMTPFMAQGAAQAIEDAVALSTCLDHHTDLAEALATYERVRRPRTDRVQRESHANQWLKDRFDPSWLYGHDVVSDLEEAGTQQAGI